MILISKFSLIKTIKLKSILEILVKTIFKFNLHGTYDNTQYNVYCSCHSINGFTMIYGICLGVCVTKTCTPASVMSSFIRSCHSISGFTMIYAICLWVCMCDSNIYTCKMYELFLSDSFFNVVHKILE